MRSISTNWKTQGQKLSSTPSPGPPACSRPAHSSLLPVGLEGRCSFTSTAGEQAASGAESRGCAEPTAPACRAGSGQTLTYAELGQRCEELIPFTPGDLKLSSVRGQEIKWETERELRTAFMLKYAGLLAHCWWITSYVPPRIPTPCPRTHSYCLGKLLQGVVQYEKQQENTCNVCN